MVSRFVFLVLALVVIVWMGMVVGVTKPKDTQGVSQCASNCCAVPGIPGVPGVPGIPGSKGGLGPQGPTGPKGEPAADYVGVLMSSNWKQCAWKIGDDRDHGLIQDCTFIKKHDNSSLRVFYGGTLRIYNCNQCCKRWYFTFDGAECTKPAAIDGVFFMKKGLGRNIHRHRHIEGYCNKIPKGHVRVGVNVGNCANAVSADAFSGWNSVSRIVIEEVPPPQA